MKHGPHDIDVFYGTPSAENLKAQELYRLNRFSVTRQLRYSQDRTALSLDLCLFINGLPIATFELKNSLTKQTVDDAVEQYKRDRNPRERLFELGRCLAHFAVDEHEVKFCTQLRGKASWFLPFNQGWNDGAGNPPNPNGLKTDYLWRQVLTRDSLTNIIENYAQIVESKDQKTGSKKRTQIWPRYHQLEVVRRLLADASANGAGKTYLIQHSAGSGKSNSIAWLAHQLIGLEREGETSLRFGDRGDRPTAAGPADPGHDQAVRAGRVGGGSRVDLRQPAGPAAGGQANRDHDGPEVPVHPEGHRRRAPGTQVRDHHRRGALEPGRTDVGGGVDGAERERQRRGRGRDNRRQDQPADGVEAAAEERQLLRLHGHAEEQDAGDLRHEGRRQPRRQAPALPRLHDEAGDPGRVHHRRGVELHAGGQLLPAG